MPLGSDAANNRFKPPTAFLPAAGEYQLLPFRFIKLDHSRYVLTNVAGEYIVTDREALVRLIKKSLDPQSDIYSKLQSRHFLIDSKNSAALQLLATKYRTKQAPLAEFTGLHMFVPTLRCNTSCCYCQVSRKSASAGGFDMTEAIADQAIGFMFRSPSTALKLEFQGGEPLLNFGLVKYIVEKARSLSRQGGRPLAIVICSNLSLISDDILEFCGEHDICFSTSLDGPRKLHNQNRPSAEFDSYERTCAGMARVRERLGVERVSALLTTTRYSLSQPTEIVDEYLKQGLTSIFLRPINPYGYAVAGVTTQYSPAEWLDFYKKALDYMINLNLKGIRIREEYTALLLRRILTPFGTGFVDLQSPAGIGISAVIFNHDGNVYPSDESRMLAEMGDQKFCLGNLLSGSYEDMMLSDILIDTLSETMAECVPCCTDCGFQPYCGADPVRHYRLQGDIVGYKPTSEFCQRHMGLFRHLIGLLEEQGRSAEVLMRWLH
jgi:His-Xaa-Ser system radical SAM maturase HxsB